MGMLIKSKGPYFAVSGPRRKLAVNSQGVLEHTGELLAPGVRFESLYLRDVEAFASRVYRQEKIVCEIHEVRR